MVARGKYFLSQFGLLGRLVCQPLRVDCASSLMATPLEVRLSQLRTATSRNSLAPSGWTWCYNKPSEQRVYTAFVHTKVLRVIGSSGIHVGTMSFGKMECDASNQNIAFILQKNEADGHYYYQEWQGMLQTKPFISGGVKACACRLSYRTWATRMMY
jgi:ribulose-bisphosphate carboxylase large chain